MKPFNNKLKNMIKADLNRFSYKKKTKNFLKINFAFFPFLWALTLSFSILESFTYSGFISKHTYLPFQLFLVLTVISGVLTRASSHKRATVKSFGDYYKFLLIAAQLLLLPLLFFTGIVSSIEKANYPNYIFNLIHLQPKLLIWPCFLTIFLIFINLGVLGKDRYLEEALIGGKGRHKKSAKNIFERLFLIGLIFWILTGNCLKISTGILGNLFFIASHLSDSYEVKMHYYWGNTYDYLNFVKRNTPPEAVIMHPPQESPWLSVGNSGLVRYFLSPRQVIQDYNDERAAVNEKADYVMIAWGDWVCSGENCHGWPKVKVPAEWIIYKDKDSLEASRRIEETTYDFNEEINKEESWGLIKVKKGQ